MLLELKGLSKRFGAVVAADAVDLKVAEGTALGIIGANVGMLEAKLHHRFHIFKFVASIIIFAVFDFQR